MSCEDKRDMPLAKGIYPLVSDQFNQKTKSPPFLLRLGFPALCCCIQCMFSRNCSLLIARYLGSIRPSLPTFLAGSASRTENHETQGERVTSSSFAWGQEFLTPKVHERGESKREKRERARKVGTNGGRGRGEEYFLRRPHRDLHQQA